MRVPHVVDLQKRFVVMTDGLTVPITDFYDDEEDPVDTPDEATYLVAGSDRLGWWSIPLARIPQITRH